MKKQILVLSVLCLLMLSFVTPAQAAKPPKELCLQFNSFADFHMLAIKKVGKVHGATANTTMYNIAGSWGAGIFYNFPVGGSGYIIPGTNTFHASFIGNGIVAGTPNIAGVELFYDLTSETGTVTYHFQRADDIIVSGSDGVTAVDCSGFDPAITTANRKSAGSQNKDN